MRVHLATYATPCEEGFSSVTLPLRTHSSASTSCHVERLMCLHVPSLTCEERHTASQCNQRCPPHPDDGPCVLAEHASPHLSVGDFPPARSPGTAWVKGGGIVAQRRHCRVAGNVHGRKYLVPGPANMKSSGHFRGILCYDGPLSSRRGRRAGGAVVHGMSLGTMGTEAARRMGHALRLWRLCPRYPAP